MARIHGAQIHSACEAARSLELTELERCGAHSQLEARCPHQQAGLAAIYALALTRLVRLACSQSHWDEKLAKGET